MYLLYYLIKILGLCLAVFGSVWMSVSLALYSYKSGDLFPIGISIILLIIIVNCIYHIVVSMRGGNDIDRHL